MCQKLFLSESKGINAVMRRTDQYGSACSHLYFSRSRCRFQCIFAYLSARDLPVFEVRISLSSDIEFRCGDAEKAHGETRNSLTKGVTSLGLPDYKRNGNYCVTCRESSRLQRRGRPHYARLIWPRAWIIIVGRRRRDFPAADQNEQDAPAAAAANENIKGAGAGNFSAITARPRPRFPLATIHLIQRNIFSRNTSAAGDCKQSAARFRVSAAGASLSGRARPRADMKRDTFDGNFFHALALLFRQSDW